MGLKLALFVTLLSNLWSVILDTSPHRPGPPGPDADPPTTRQSYAHGILLEAGSLQGGRLGEEAASGPGSGPEAVGPPTSLRGVPQLLCLLPLACLLVVACFAVLLPVVLGRGGWLRPRCVGYFD